MTKLYPSSKSTVVTDFYYVKMTVMEANTVASEHALHWKDTCSKFV